TNQPMIRADHQDVVYASEPEKYEAVADEIVQLREKGQPVLVGTVSIEKSERLSALLKTRKVPHVVLNAKFHEKEAEIVAQAGRLGMVTISTNMAGRGTDILLGGNPEFMARQDLVKRDLARAVSDAEGAISPVAPAGFFRFYYQSQEFEVPLEQWETTIAAHEANTKADHDAVIAAGGLHILGTERHESRRVDNQLRGRAGRQGDPGSSRFFLSLEDDLMRIFAREWVSKLLQSLGMEEGVPIESRMISKRIEAAQQAVESQNFESRKHVLEYDDVMNKQREAVYSLRRQLMEGVEQKQLVTDDYASTILSGILDENAPEKAHPDQWNYEKIAEKVEEMFGLKVDPEELTTMSRHEIGETLFERLGERYNLKERILTEPTMRYHERVVMLSVLDGLWKEHLLNMDHLKEGIGLRGYAQQDPLVAYKKESYDMFASMMLIFQEDVARHLFRMQILAPDGSAIETEEQFAALQQRHAIPSQPAMPNMPRPAQTSWQPNQTDSVDDTQLPVVPTRAPQTTIDALEREFEQKKQRELSAARQAGGSATATATPQRVVGQQIGRNDPCYCGSGKKFKKCHGVNA
ncbi:MAG: SEC-C metal-binding domain-containing protein, partial [Bryocella sp.]